MKLSCSHCGQMSADGHLWCQQIDCPAGHVPMTFTYGEYLGDIQIIRLLRVFRTAAIYEGKRGDTSVLLKVAHANQSETLKLEAEILEKFVDEEGIGLPVLLPPYEGADVHQISYGKATFRGELKYYLLFKYQQGFFLRDMLHENPEPWYNHAAWITLDISRALSHLHGAGVLHLCLNPDIVLVDVDPKTRIPTVLLLDMGIMLSGDKLKNPSYQRILDHVPPSYAAPELLNQGSISNMTDVYGVAMILYEMLAGHPAYPYSLRSVPEIHQVIRDQVRRPPRLERRDVPDFERLEQIFDKALDGRPNSRYTGVTALREDILEVFGDKPIVTLPWYRDRQMILRSMVFGGSAFSVVFILAVLIAEFLE